MRPRLRLRGLAPDRQTEVLKELDQASAPGFDFFLLVVLSCSIVAFGLITDSAAVIIGAMLVALLMSPILGLSLASVAGERRMFQPAVIALVEGALLAGALSTLIGATARASPFGALSQLPAEILACIHPTPFDLGVALAGGAAAAYCLAQPKLSAVLAGCVRRLKSQQHCIAIGRVVEALQRAQRLHVSFQEFLILLLRPIK